MRRPGVGGAHRSTGDNACRMTAVIHDSPSRFIDTAQAAELLRVSPTTIRRLIHRHELPAVRIGGVYRIDAAVLNARLRRSMTGS